MYIFSITIQYCVVSLGSFIKLNYD